MSLPQFPANEPQLTRENAINQILSSIAMEELGLSHIINAEGEKLQFVLGTLPGSTGPDEPITIDDLLALNKSIRKTLDSTMLNQMFLKAKMEGALHADIRKEPCPPFLSSYMEALGDEQTLSRNSAIIFDSDSFDSEGNNIELSDDGKVFTIKRPGLYHIEWMVNLANGDYSTPAVIGTIENGEPASGASSSGPGSFSSGTIINVVSVPFTLSLVNFGEAITIDRHIQYINSSASIRIVRFADGPSQ